MKKSLVFVATAATLAVACVAAASSAEARTHHGIYRGFGNAYSYVPRYAPRYGYAIPYGPPPYRYYGHINSNLNPDRQMVGIGD